MGTTAWAFSPLASPLLANAGTPLMWAGMLHLVFGNFIIGIVEGAILAKAFRLRMRVCIPIMIAANYFSAWVGHVALSRIAASVHLDLYTARRFLWMLVGLTYTMTLLLESPFVAFCLRGSIHRFRRTLKASLLVQTATYIPLFTWYWLASGTSLYARLNVVPPSQLSLPANINLYYISAADGSVRVQSSRSPAGKMLYDLKSRSLDDRLFARKPAGDRPWDLVACLDPRHGEEPTLTVIAEAFADTAPIDPYLDVVPVRPTWENSGRAARLGSASDSPWELFSGHWAFEGLIVENAKTKERLHLALEVPYIAWPIRNVTHLPGDQALFQLGDDQICLLDLPSRRIALIAKGRGPTAAPSTRPSTNPK